MSPRDRFDDWLDDDEYPDDHDVDEFGDDSPHDDDLLTIGRVPGVHQPFWTKRRILVALVALLLLVSLVLADLAQMAA